MNQKLNSWNNDYVSVALDHLIVLLQLPINIRGAWWHIGWVDAFRRKVMGSNPALAAKPGTLGKSFTYSCL